MMNKKPQENTPEVTTTYHVVVLILLWLFILVWISPLASLAASRSPESSVPDPGFARAADVAVETSPR